MGISPAALRALVDGDIENAIVASTPGGIERQEAKGQRTFVASKTLPKECLYSTREQLEALGIVFHEDADDLFVRVTLPQGWRKVATSHSMHSDLVDEQGRKRASIFYKAAFYDRCAFITLNIRYRHIVQPIGGFEVDFHDRPYIGVVLDQDKVIWQTEDTASYDDWKKKDELQARAYDWLVAHYPDWQNPLAYWDT